MQFSKLYGKYKNNGKFIPPATIEKSEKTITSSTNHRIDILNDDLIANRISLQKWEKEFAKELKTLHVKRALISRGGKNIATPEDWLSIGRDLKSEYKYLHQMAVEIKNGTVSPAQLKARTKLYTERSRLAGETMKQANAKESDLVYMMRKLGATDRNCGECLSYASAGLKRIGELPLPTVACSCRANCKCSVQYFGSRVRGS
jgi:hypothetical protein